MSTQRQNMKSTTMQAKISQNSWAKVSSSGSIIYNFKFLLALFKHFSSDQSMPKEDETVSTETPKPIAVFLCERVLRDVLRPDAISAVNIHNQMTVQTFPAIVPLVFAFAMVTGSHHEFTYQFKFLDKQHQVIAVSNVQKVAPLPNTNYTHTLIGAFQGLVFHEEGTYHLQLSLDGEDVGSLGFQVIHFVPEPVAQA